jgi:hypothetical protein
MHGADPAFDAEGIVACDERSEQEKGEEESGPGGAAEIRG